MRVALLVIAIVAAGCPGSLETDALSGDDKGGENGAGTGGAPTECNVASDCVAAGPKCCDCPTHALPATSPTARACNEVNCPTKSCGSPMEAACNDGRCELVCSPVVVNMSCPNGFVTDGNGCLIDMCAPAADPGQCSVDTDCARVRDDCCGCAMGGKDTAIPAGQVPSHDASLGCSANPVCPGNNVCAMNLAARCVQGECALVSGALPANACGRADLPACPSGERCTVNANDQATMYGVGVCRP